MVQTTDQAAGTDSAAIGALVSDLIEALGPDPAAELARQGFKGYRLLHTSCPLARYLTPHLPGEYWVAVGSDNVAVWEGGDRRDYGAREVATVELPECVQAFILAFDNGRHPELMADDD